jgi:PEP-CTERM motif-containing protein
VSFSLAGRVRGDWRLTASNNNNQVLTMFFTTSPTAASLVGLSSGNIESPGSIVKNEVTGLAVYEGLEGSITPAVSAPPPNVPEPSSLVLLAVGFLACLWFGFARKRTLNG